MNMKRPPLTPMLLACMLVLLPITTRADTLERVRASNSLTLGYLNDFAPFSTQDGDKAKGFAIDLCQTVVDKLKAELALPALQVRYQAVRQADEISAVHSGKIDILCTPTPQSLERRKSVSFSVPIYTAGLSAVVRQDAPPALLNVLNGQEAHTGPTWRATLNRGLSNQTFAAPAGGVTEQWIRGQMRTLGVITTLVTVENSHEGLKQVADGKVAAFFAERMLLKNQLAADYPDSNLMVLDRIYEYAPASMVMERGNEDLRLLVDTALSEAYRSGAMEQAYAKYLGGASDTVKKLFKIYALP